MDQLDSGIAVHSTDKHQQTGFRSTKFSHGRGERGNKQWGKHSIPPAILAFLQKGGRGEKLFLRFFLRNPFLRRAGH